MREAGLAQACLQPDPSSPTALSRLGVRQGGPSLGKSPGPQAGGQGQSGLGWASLVPGCLCFSVETPRLHLSLWLL